MTKVIVILLIAMMTLPAACVSEERSTNDNEIEPVLLITETEEEKFRREVLTGLNSCLDTLAAKALEEKEVYFENPNLEQLANKYTFDNYKRRVHRALLDLIRERNTWKVDEKYESVYIVSGYGLGYAEGQMSYGSWYYYKSTGNIEPINQAGEELKDLFTLEGSYIPEYTGIHPDTGLTHVNPEMVIFIWKPQVPLQGKYEAEVVISSIRNVDANGDLIKEPPAFFCITDAPIYVHDKPLEYGTEYYWQVIESGSYYLGYINRYREGGFARHPIRSFTTMLRPHINRNDMASEN